MLLVSPTVSDDRYSYPFDSTGYAVAQSSFFAQHLFLLVGVLALLGLTAVRASRGARVGSWIGLIGMIGLTIAELVAISGHETAVGSDHASAIEAVYGIVVPLSGLGFLVAGIALMRGSRDPWAGASSVPPLVLVIGVSSFFVPMTPAIIASYDAARIAIGVWMLLFAALGLGLSRIESSARRLQQPETLRTRESRSRVPLVAQPALQRVAPRFFPTTITARPPGTSRGSQRSSSSCSAALPIRIGGLDQISS